MCFSVRDVLEGKLRIEKNIKPAIDSTQPQTDQTDRLVLIQL